MCLQPNGIEVVRKFGAVSSPPPPPLLPVPSSAFACLVMRILSGGRNFARFDYTSKAIVSVRRARQPFANHRYDLLLEKARKLQCINLMRVDVLILRINFKEPSVPGPSRRPSLAPFFRPAFNPGTLASLCANSRCRIFRPASKRRFDSLFLRLAARLHIFQFVSRMKFRELDAARVAVVIE